MKAIESFLSAPLLVTLLGGAQITLRGRADAEDIVIATNNGSEIVIDPFVGLMILGGLLFSGIILVAREMRAEAKESRQRKDLID